AASEAADVVVITISRVLELSPPAIGPAKPAYRPWTGLTPTRTAAAIPSGTLPIAPGNPATMSARRCRRTGRTERSQRPAPATAERIQICGPVTCAPPASGALPRPGAPIIGTHGPAG